MEKVAVGQLTDFSILVCMVVSHSREYLKYSENRNFLSSDLVSAIVVISLFSCWLGVRDRYSEKEQIM